jgi:hypothetical protein
VKKPTDAKTDGTKATKPATDAKTEKTEKPATEAKARFLEHKDVVKLYRLLQDKKETKAPVKKD